MKKKIIIFLCLSCLMLTGCQEPQLLTEFLLTDYLEEELNYPLVVRSLEDAEIPCLQEHRYGYLEFPCRSTAGTSFETDEETPYWAIALRNHGHGTLTVSIDGSSVTVPAGTGSWIYTAKAAEPGEHVLSFSVESGGPMKGFMELWRSETPEKIVPSYQMNAKVISVHDDYFQAEPWHYEGVSKLPQVFYVSIGEKDRGQPELHPGDLVQISHCGDFTGSQPLVLREITELKVLESDGPRG